MVHCPAALLFLAAFLQFGVASRVTAEDDSLTSNWWDGYCRQNGIEDNCKTFALEREADCLAHFDAMVAAPNQVQYGILRFSGKTTMCTTLFSIKEDVLYDEQNLPAQTIKLAAKACGTKSMDVCVAATCPTYCALKKRDDCDCKTLCNETSKKMWGTGSIQCSDDNKWSECIDAHHSKLKEDGRIPELEAIFREHTLKCVCVSRLKDDSMCYQGSQGITPGQKWCEFNKNPSWQLLLKSEKPAAWKSDWLNEPKCSLKEVTL